MRRAVIIIATIFSIILIGIVGVLFYVKNKYQPIGIQIAQNIDLRHYPEQHASFLYHQNKQTGGWDITETLYDGQDNMWIPYQELPQCVKDAVVAIEDKRFFDHHGVDWKRTIHAAWQYIVKRDPNAPGGSSLTQQLIKNLTQNTEYTADRKISEIFAALELEKRISKKEILEQYLNQIYYANHCIGIYRAARKYFGKEVSELTVTEAAILISIPNRPDYYDPYKHPHNAKRRAATVLFQMFEQEMLSESEVKEALSPIGYVLLSKGDTAEYVMEYHPEIDSLIFYDGSIQTGPITEQNGHVYSWYTDAVLDQVAEDLSITYGISTEQANMLMYRGGLRIYTCIDMDIQAIVDAEYNDRYRTTANWAWGQEYPPQSAITIIDNESGAVVAMSGGLGYKETSRMWNRAVDTVRPSGSSIKPLGVYGPALDLGVVQPDTVIEDSMFRLDEHGRPWPVNAEGYYSGYMTIHDAVVRSVNTVAVKTLDRVGVETAYVYLTDHFHLTSLLPADMDYAPIALGGFTKGVSTYEMAAAFSVFPRHGIYKAPHVYSRVEDREGNILLAYDDIEEYAISPEAAYAMTSILQDAVSYGTGTGANLYDMPTAGKTGTTSDSYDLWFCGFTPYYTASVWTGYDTQIAMGNSAYNPSCGIFRDIMSQVHAVLPYATW